MDGNLNFWITRSLSIPSQSRERDKNCDNGIITPDIYTTSQNYGGVLNKSGRVTSFIYNKIYGGTTIYNNELYIDFTRTSDIKYIVTATYRIISGLMYLLSSPFCITFPIKCQLLNAA